MKRFGHGSDAENWDAGWISDKRLVCCMGFPKTEGEPNSRNVVQHMLQNEYTIYNNMT